VKQSLRFVAVILIGCLPVIGAQPTPVQAPTNSVSSGDSPALRKVLSNKPFFGTARTLTLNGTYVNTPTENLQQTGVWDTWGMPLSLDQMHGMIAEAAFGDDKRRGQWQVTYRRRMMTMDSDWPTIASANSTLSLSDRRSQVLKANYNVRDWWKVGVAAVVQDRYSVSPNLSLSSFGPAGRDSLGFQVDTSLKF